MKFLSASLPNASLEFLSSIEKRISVSSLRALRKHPQNLFISKNSSKRLRIAIVRFDGLGDYVLTLPLLESLQQEVGPEAEISLVCPPNLADFMAETQGTKVLAIKPISMHYPPKFLGKYSDAFRVSAFGRLAAFTKGLIFIGRFDLVIVPRWSSDAAFWAKPWALGTGAVVIGHGKVDQDFWFDGLDSEDNFLTKKVLSPGLQRHEIDHLNDLIEGLELSTAAQPGYGRRVFGLPHEQSFARKLVVHVGATNAKRCWPAENWSAFLKYILETDNEIEIQIVGSAEEAAFHREIISKTSGERIESLAGLEFAKLPKIMSTAHFFVGNDSGPMHIAASMEVPCLVVTCHPRNGSLGHDNSPTRFGPWGTEKIICQPLSGRPGCESGCTAKEPHCITDVSVDEMKKSWEKLTSED